MTETRRFSPRRLRGLFEPQSLALVGASDKSSWSMMVHNNLTLGEYTGRIYYINPRNPAVHGRPAVPRLADIGEPVDLAYRKPSAKAPVIHPGDEVPLLVWGGEGSALRAAMRRLTEAGKPAMLGIDVLAQDKA